MREVFALVRCWSPYSSAQEQVWSQNYAEAEFDRHVKQIKQAGVEVSPIQRSMRITKDEDEGFPGMARYYLRVAVEGPEQEMQHLKDIFARKCPPVYVREAV